MRRRQPRHDRRSARCRNRLRTSHEFPRIFPEVDNAFLKKLLASPIRIHRLRICAPAPLNARLPLCRKIRGRGTNYRGSPKRRQGGFRRQNPAWAAGTTRRVHQSGSATSTQSKRTRSARSRQRFCAGARGMLTSCATDHPRPGLWQPDEPLDPPPVAKPQGVC